MAEPVTLISLRQALHRFVRALETQSAGHIKPLHAHIASRLVIEGGFRPEDITPRPPFRVEESGRGAGRRITLTHDPKAAGSGEQTVLGGVKTKQVDVVVSKPGVGPCLAISVKGTLNAFRNLTNRMEEAIGDCTNLHMSYPALVYGFIHVIKATTEAQARARNDIAVLASGEVAEEIRRYHDAMTQLTGRFGVRDDFTRYEAVALALVSQEGESTGDVLTSFPATGSPVLLGSFFESLYRVYDQRFVYAAPSLASVTARLQWDSASPAIPAARAAALMPRLASQA